MARDPRYDILFEPVRIGPLTVTSKGLCQGEEGRGSLG